MCVCVSIRLMIKTSLHRVHDKPGCYFPQRSHKRTAHVNNRVRYLPGITCTVLVCASLRGAYLHPVPTCNHGELPAISNKNVKRWLKHHRQQSVDGEAREGPFTCRTSPSLHLPPPPPSITLGRLPCCDVE